MVEDEFVCLRIKIEKVFCSSLWWCYSIDYAIEHLYFDLKEILDKLHVTRGYWRSDLRHERVEKAIFDLRTLVTIRMCVEEKIYNSRFYKYKIYNPRIFYKVISLALDSQRCVTKIALPKDG